MALVRTILRKACNDWEWLDRAPKMGMFKDAEGRTYASNMCDWATLKRHMKEFNRRMSKIIPGWFYVAAFERQKRGAWHAHMAVHRMPSELALKPGVTLKSFNVSRLDSLFKQTTQLDSRLAS